MPDMNVPGAYFGAALDRMRYKARHCRDEAQKLITQAEVYEEAASNIEDAIDREAQKSSEGKSGG